MSLLEFYVKYHTFRCSASVSFAQHLCIQKIGHTLGWRSINRIKPRAVKHNTYLCLLGQSGKTMKSTAQEEVSMPTIPLRYRGPKSFTPQGLLRELEERPQLICPFGEFSTALRGIKAGKNMADFKEISNDLHSCPELYEKRLRDKKDSYFLKKPYYSASTTCTPEEFFGNITPDMVNGGFLPRWILCYSEPQKKSREPLPKNIDDIERIILIILNEMYKYFDKNPQIFELNKDAYDTYYRIVDELEEGEEWEDVQPFVARYQRYIIVYADALYISDKLGEELSKLCDLGKLFELSDLSEFRNVIATSVGASLHILLNSLNSLTADYIERAWALLKPSLEYAKKVTKYVNEDFNIAKVKTILEKVNDRITWSDLLRKSGFNKDKLRLVVLTLCERGEIKQEYERKGEGKGMKITEYIVKTKDYGK